MADDSLLKSVCQVVTEKMMKHREAAEEAEGKDDAVAAMIHHIVVLTMHDIIEKGLNASCSTYGESLPPAPSAASSDELNDKLIKDTKERCAKVMALQDHVRGIVQAAQCNNQDAGFSCDEVSQTVLRGQNVVTFDDIVGFESIKSELTNAIIQPLEFPNLYPSMPKGVLFYGLPGTGKTFFVKGLVHALNKKFRDTLKILLYSPTGAELKGKYVGETEKRINALFDCASLAAYNCACDNKEGGPKKALSIIFIDEIENIAGDRASDQSGLMANSVNVLLQKMDGVASSGNVLVLAATNFPWKLDSAILRRFTRQIYVGLPSHDAIRELIKKDIKKAFLAGVSNSSELACNEKRINEIEGKHIKKQEKQKECSAIDDSSDSKTDDAYEKLKSIVDKFCENNNAIFGKIATALKSANFSNSDVSRLVNKVMYIAAEKTLSQDTKFMALSKTQTATDILYYIDAENIDLHKNAEAALHLSNANYYLEKNGTQQLQITIGDDIFIKPYNTFQYLKKYGGIVSHAYATANDAKVLLQLKPLPNCNGCLLVVVTKPIQDHQTDNITVYYSETDLSELKKASSLNNTNPITVFNVPDDVLTKIQGRHGRDNVTVKDILKQRIGYDTICKTPQDLSAPTAVKQIAEYILVQLKLACSRLFGVGQEDPTGVAQERNQQFCAKDSNDIEDLEDIDTTALNIVDNLYSILNVIPSSVMLARKIQDIKLINVSGSEMTLTLASVATSSSLDHTSNTNLTVIDKNHVAKIKTLNISKPDFDTALLSVSTSIRKKELEEVERYAKDPSTFQPRE